MSRRLNCTLLLFHAISLLLIGFAGSIQADPPAIQADNEPILPEQSIHQVLAKPIQLDLIDIPFSEAVRHLEKTTGIEIQLDNKALEEMSFNTDEHVTLRVADISARSALELLLRQMDLTWIILDDTLWITTNEAAEEYEYVKVYNVADLVRTNTPAMNDDPNGESVASLDSLIVLITQWIHSESWDHAGGSGTIAGTEIAGKQIVLCKQKRQVHEEIEQLLADIRAARHQDVPKKDSSEHEPVERPTQNVDYSRDPKAIDWKAAIYHTLQQRVTLNYQETPLSDVCRDLSDKMKIPIVIDRRILADMGIAPDVPITFRISNVRLRSALNLMLRELDLTWTVYREVLLITTCEEESENLSTRVYDVSDLPSYRNEQGQVVYDYDSLADIIFSTIHPESWDFSGPAPTIDYEAPGIRVLVLSQTNHIHEEIEALLSEIRRVRGPWSPERDIEKLPNVPPQSHRRRDGLGIYHSGMPTDSLPRHERPATLAPDAERDAVVQSNNQFAFDLYGKLREGTNGNILFSPPTPFTSKVRGPILLRKTERIPPRLILVT